MTDHELFTAIRSVLQVLALTDPDTALPLLIEMDKRLDELE